MVGRAGAPLDDIYLDWLIRPLFHKRRETPTVEVCHEMFKTPFIVRVARDKNRVSDGKLLREEFLTKRPGLSDSQEVVAWGWLRQEASVLEVLLALADRTSYNSYGDCADWFMTFVKNLGLFGERDRTRIRRHIQRFVHRTYEPNGVGGIFPIKYPMEDQRDVELWYQAAAYLDSPLHPPTH